MYEAICYAISPLILFAIIGLAYYLIELVKRKYKEHKHWKAFYNRKFNYIEYPDCTLMVDTTTGKSKRIK